jgi:hypothetical protein
MDALNTVEVYDAKTDTRIWFGEIQETPREVAQGESIEVLAVGTWDGPFKRRKWRKVWKDTDYGQWVDMRPLISTNADKFSLDNQNRLMVQIQEGMSYANNVSGGFRYRMQGSEQITRINWTRHSILANPYGIRIDVDGASAWNSAATGGVDDSGSLTGLTAATVDFVMYATGAATGGTSQYYGQLEGVTVLSGANDSASEIITEILQSAPASAYIDTDMTNISATTYAWPHFAIRESIPIADIIERANAVEGYDFAVWGDNKAYYAARSSTVGYCTRLDMGADYQMAPTTLGLANVAIAPYENTSMTGWADHNLETSVTYASTELDAAGETIEEVIPGEYKSLAIAQAAASAYLDEHSVYRPTGTLVIQPGELLDSSGAFLDPWMIFAPANRGGNIRILDLLPVDDALETTFDAKTTGAIAAGEWSHDDQTLTLTLDAASMSYEATMERVMGDVKIGVERPGPFPNAGGARRKKAYCYMHKAYEWADVARRHNKIFRARTASTRTVHSRKQHRHKVWTGTGKTRRWHWGPWHWANNRHGQ